MTNLPLPTQRLQLRIPTPNDLSFLLSMNQDPAVMEFMPGIMDREATRDQLDKIIQHHEDHGFGLYLAETKGAGEPVGIVGLKHVNFEAAFVPAVEVAWRFAHPFWGKGYATEGAREILRFGFKDLEFSELVGFTVPQNVRSIAVFDRLSFSRDPTFDFKHPKLKEGDPLLEHVFFRLSAKQWASDSKQSTPR